MNSSTEAAELRVVWDVTSCGTSRLPALLAQGWEPFAVTTSPTGMRTHQCEGQTTFLEHTVWLKRLKVP